MRFSQKVKIVPRDKATQGAVTAAEIPIPPLKLTVIDAEGPLNETHLTLPHTCDEASCTRKTRRLCRVRTISCSGLHQCYDIAVRTVNWDLERRVLMMELESKSDDKAKWSLSMCILALEPTFCIEIQRSVL